MSLTAALSHPVRSKNKNAFSENPDSIDVYMNDLRRRPMLTREQEQDIALEYARTRDPALAHKLVVANLRLVVKLANQYSRSRRNLIDLVQEGNEGLVQAVLRYDPTKNVKLSSFAAWWIRARMLKSILNDSRLVKLGTTQAQRKLFFNLRREQEKLEMMGVTVTDSMLAEKMSVCEQEVAEMRQRLCCVESSLNAPVATDDGEGERTAIDLLQGCAAARPDARMEEVEFQHALGSKLRKFERTLEGRCLMLFRDRLMSENPKTLKEIGQSIGVSRERMRQIEVALLTRLKAFLEREMGSAVAMNAES